MKLKFFQEYLFLLEQGSLRYAIKYILWILWTLINVLLSNVEKSFQKLSHAGYQLQQLHSIKSGRSPESDLPFENIMIKRVTLLALAFGELNNLTNNRKRRMSMGELRIKEVKSE